MDILGHMDRLANLAGVVTDALEAADLSENRAAELTGIARATLRRRLMDGDFRYGQLWLVAEVLETTPANLTAQAEQATA